MSEGSCLKWISIPPIFTKWLIHTCNLMWPVEGGRLQCQPGRSWSRGPGMCPVTLGNWLNLSCPFHKTGIKHPLCLTLGSLGRLNESTHANYSSSAKHKRGSQLSDPTYGSSDITNVHLLFSVHHILEARRGEGGLLPGRDFKLLKVFQRCCATQE